MTLQSRLERRRSVRAASRQRTALPDPSGRAVQAYQAIVNGLGDSPSSAAISTRHPTRRRARRLELDILGARASAAARGAHFFLRSPPHSSPATRRRRSRRAPRMSSCVSREAGDFLYVIAVRRGSGTSRVGFSGLPRRRDGQPITGGEVTCSSTCKGRSGPCASPGTASATGSRQHDARVYRFRRSDRTGCRGAPGGGPAPFPIDRPTE